MGGGEKNTLFDILFGSLGSQQRGRKNESRPSVSRERTERENS